MDSLQDCRRLPPLRWPPRVHWQSIGVSTALHGGRIGWKRDDIVARMGGGDFGIWGRCTGRGEVEEVGEGVGDAAGEV